MLKGMARVKPSFASDTSMAGKCIFSFRTGFEKFREKSIQNGCITLPFANHNCMR